MIIYLLIERHLNDEDDFGTPIFASKYKESCEKKHQEILLANSLHKRIAEHVKKCLDVESKLLGDPPKSPNLVDLPSRPLVWADGGWKNSYTIEYNEVYNQYSKKQQDLMDSITTELAAYYKVDKQAVSLHWLHHSPSYEIEEVESDIE